MRISMNGVWFVFVVSFLVVAEGDGFFQQQTPADAHKTKYPNIFGKSLIRRLIESNGYGYENYTVTTEDGYLLNLNRIIHPNRTGSDRGYPLLLVNGFFMQSEAWLVQHKLDSNIALVFANQGYDVWLGDQRGTMRSKGHVNLTADDKRLWDYSFHETGLYDISAFTDFILKKTSYKDLVFSCMSLGCSFHAVLLSKRPSYNQKIRAAIYFVPLVNNIRKISDMVSFMHVWFRYQHFFVDILERAGVYDWFPFMGTLKKELYHLCRPTGSLPVLGARLVSGSAFHTPANIFEKAGHDWLPYMGNLKKEFYHICRPLGAMPVWGTKFFFGAAFHAPSEALCSIAISSLGGANPKSTRHVLQVYDTGDFAEYDYGREENKKRYGTEWPPLYDMSKITSPIAFYYSDADVFATPKGIEKTIKSIGGPSYDCKLPNFNHLDIASGTTFRFVLPDVVDLLNSLTGYNNHTGKLKSGKCPSMEWIRHLQ